MSEDKSLLDDTREEHRECMEVVGELVACLERHPDDAAEWVVQLDRQLGILEKTMREHFAVEEKGPLYSGLPVSHPRLAGRLRALESEHGAMLVAIDRVKEKARALDDPEPYELRELNARAQLLVAQIQRHEAQENEIVLEAHWGEVGVGD